MRVNSNQQWLDSVSNSRRGTLNPADCRMSAVITLFHIAISLSFVYQMHECERTLYLQLFNKNCCCNYSFFLSSSFTVWPQKPYFQPGVNAAFIQTRDQSRFVTTSTTRHKRCHTGFISAATVNERAHLWTVTVSWFYRRTQSGRLVRDGWHKKQTVWSSPTLTRSVSSFPLNVAHLCVTNTPGSVHSCDL